MSDLMEGIAEVSKLFTESGDETVPLISAKRWEDSRNVRSAVRSGSKFGGNPIDEELAVGEVSEGVDWSSFLPA